VAAAVCEEDRFKEKTPRGHDGSLGVLLFMLGLRTGSHPASRPGTL